MDKYTAFIPVRGGSKSIPMKNIRPIGGRPLLFWVLDAASNCEAIDRVVVSTDSEVIMRTVEHAFPFVDVFERSAETACDTASTESAITEWVEAEGASAPENIILIQATSPLLTSEDLSGGIAEFERGDFGSLLSVVRQKRFVWSTEGENGAVRPMNYDYEARPRRQEFDGYLVENGAFYIVPTATYKQTGCRLAEPVGCFEMDEKTYYEIDEPSDWPVIEHLLALNNETHATSAAPANIKAVLTDCDGVLTDAGMYYSAAGDELKCFSAQDGMGFSRLRQAGILTGIITGETTPIVENRAKKLKLTEVHMGVMDKLSVLLDICERNGISPHEVAYIGDDVNDISVLELVGFGCSVRNGTQAAKDAARYTTSACGGAGAFREVAELVLAARKDTEE